MNWLGRILEKLVKESKKTHEWRTFVFCLAAVVVFTTTYSLILPAITVETNTTDSVGGLVMEEADPESTGAGAEASGDVVTVDAENEPSDTVESPMAPEENVADTASAPAPVKESSEQTQSVYEETNEQEEVEEYRQPYNGEVQTYGDRRIMYLTGDDFDVMVSGDLSVDVPDGTILSVRGIPDQSVVKSYSDRISEELLKLYVDRKTTEVLYRLVFTDKDQYEYTPAGYFDIQFYFHRNSVDHSRDLIYAAIYNYLTDEMILAEKNGDVYETPVIYLDEYGAISSINLKGINFNEFSDIITLVAGPVNEKLKLEAEKAAAGTESEPTSEKEDEESGSEKDKTTDGKTESGSEKDKTTDSKTESGSEKDKTTDSKTESGRDKDKTTDSKTESGSDKDKTTDSKTESGSDKNKTTDSKTESGSDKDKTTDSKTESGSDKDKTTDSKTNYESGSLAARGSDYTVTLAYGADAKIPGSAALEVKEIDNSSNEYKKYLAQAKAAMGLDEDQELPKEQARFFDIKIMADGEEVQPAANVSVNITYDQPVVEADSDTEAQIDASAVHFGKRGAEVVEVSESDTASVEFEAESFSVYGVIYTVDFETVDGGTYSVLGGYEYFLTDILSVLGIDLTDSEIAEANFSNTSVLYCYQNEDGLWKLNSVGPFFTKETLIIKTVDGRIYRIKVSDAAIDYEGVTYANVAELSDTVSVKANGTNLNNEQDRNKTFSLTFDFTMLYDNAAEARSNTYLANGTYNWCYDLSQMAEEYPEIAEFPNMPGILRSGTTTLGTYEVIGNKVYMHVRPETLNPQSQRISGKFNLDMQLDEAGTGSKDSTTFNFPGGGSITVKYKPIEYENGTKSANPTSAVVYPSDAPDGFYYVDYTADLSERVELTSVTFNDILGPGQELVTSSVKVNGIGTSVSPTGNVDDGQAFSLNIMNALGVSSIPANTPVQVTYTVRVPKEKIDAAGGSGLSLSNNADWDIGNVDVPGGETTVNLQKGDYTGPTKSIVNSSSYVNPGSDKVVDPNGDKIGDAVKAKETWQNTDGTYHISYKVSFSEGAVPSTMGMSDTYGSEQSLLTDSFTVTYNGQKYAIPSSYISNGSGSFSISNLKGAIEEATGVPFAKGVNYEINYETQVTAANFNKPITNQSTLILDTEYPSDETMIELTSEDFQPGQKKNTSGKSIQISNTDDTTTDWEISITEPKKANQKAELTDTFDSSRMTVDTNSFKVKIAYNEEFDIPSSYVNVSGNQFTLDLNGVLAYLKNNQGYTGQPFVEGGKNYAITYTTTANTNAITQDINSSSDGSKTLENTANWVFKDENPPSEQPGGKDDVTYTIPDYKDTSKTDTVSGNVNRLYSSQNGATYEVTGAGPYTVNYTITVPAQDMDLTRVQLTDTYSTNQTLNTGSFVLTVGGQTVTIPQGALNSSTPGQFTLDVLQAMGISSLEKGKEIRLTYSTTTSTVGEDITNKSVWSFNSVAGEYTDEKETKEKLDKPEYKPGSKYVRNENANKELTDLTENDKYRFDWTLTITEPGELTKAILKDDYGTSDKPHTMMIDSEHPMTITAGSNSITFDSLSAFTSSNAVTYDSATGRFSIDMIRLFNVEKFPAGTTFRAEYSTETTGDTVPDPGTYHNAATWDFDGIGGPENDIPGGENETTLTPKEFDDGTKTSYYNGQRLTGGKFREDGSTIIDYVATIGQDSGVTLLNFTDDWGDDRINLVYPIVVKDSSGTVIHAFSGPESGWLSVTDTGFVVQVVKDGKLQNGNDFVKGTTYSVEYSLDFAETANSEGDYSGVVIRNTGHWHTEGDLPPHDDDHETPDEPESPPWKPIDKSVTDVKYTNSDAGIDSETSLDHTEGSDTWWSDQYTKGDASDHSDNGTFYINYEATMNQPRNLTGLELTDVTNIPGGTHSEIRNDGTTKLTIYDASGNVATWGQLLGNDNASQAVFDDITISSGVTEGNLSYYFDVIDYLKGAMGASRVVIPKDFTTKLEFQIALLSNMDDEGYPRVNTDPDKWHNKITAKFNGTHEEYDEVDTLIKTRLSVNKVFSSVEGSTETPQENGVRLDPGSRVKYTITVGNDGDVIPEGGYIISDTMTNVFVQNFDTAAGIQAADKSGNSVAGTVEYHYYYIGNVSYVDSFTYTIPSGTICPVTITYYVDNTTQEQADVMNEDNNSQNDLFGEQTENNTVRSPEDKEVTTEYLVNYTTGHHVDKQLSRWDSVNGTVFWTVQVTANDSQNPSFKAGYKVKEDLYKYTQTAPAGETWTESEINAAEDMELDLSGVIVMNNSNRLTLGTDYEIQGNSIVLLRDQNAGKTLKISNIRTTIPGWNEDTTPKTYYYNDASYRTPTDSLLDEDDDNNDTDLVAHLKKKFAEYDKETGNVTWTITVTPRKGEDLYGYKIEDLFREMYQLPNKWQAGAIEKRAGTLISHTGVKKNSNTPLTSGEDYTYVLGANDEITINSHITEPIEFTLTYKVAYNEYDVFNADSFKLYNKARGYFPQEEPEEVEDEHEITNEDIDISKELSSGTEEKLEVGSDSYPLITDLGDGVYEYTVKINSSKTELGKTHVVFTDHLPDGFQLVDYSNENTDSFRVLYTGGKIDQYGNNSYVTNVLLDATVEPQNAEEGRQTVTLTGISTRGYNGAAGEELIIRYKVKLTDPKKAELANIKTGAIQYFENTATVRTETRSGTATETVVYQYTEALKKEDVTNESSAHSGGLISYEILVNAEGTYPNYTARNLNSGNPLTLVDDIPTSVELARDTVKVYKWTGSSWQLLQTTDNEDAIVNGTGYSVSYHGDTRELLLRLADETSFKVEFSSWAEKTTPDTDGDGELDDEEGQHFINTATLTGEGQFVAKTDEQHKVYTTEGGLEDVPFDGFAIEKFDENNLTKALDGAEFTLYKVKEYNEIPSSFLIPDTNEWDEIETKTTANGNVKFSGLSYAQPIGTGEEGNGWGEEYSRIQVVLYAWVESGMTQELKDEGYQIGDNALPHFFIMYYNYRADPENPQDPVEIKKEASSYALADLFDGNLQSANFITVNKAKTQYTWPVQNAAKTTKTVTKLWDDYNDKNGVRPKANEVHVQLMQNDQPYGQEVTLIDATIDKNNPKYTYTWVDLPLADPVTKEEYTYTVVETQIDENYVATYSGDTFTITNHLVDNSTFIVNKVWDDNDNVERKRPQSITYTLYQEDESGNLREYDSQTVGYAENFSYKWEELPTVDDPDDPTTTYSYFVQETKMTAADGTEYVLDENTGKLVNNGTALYVSSAESVDGAENVYKITNTVVSSRTGSVKLTKTLTGLIGNHSDIDAGIGTKADEKTYSVTLTDSDGYKIFAVLDNDKSTDELKVYNFDHIQNSGPDYTVFSISEKVSVQVNNLPLGAYSYTVTENTSGDMAISGYEFDASASGGSVTTVQVQPENDPDNENPVEANLINNYIPDKGNLSLTKEVHGLPDGVDAANYRFPVTITTQSTDENGDPETLYLNAQGKLVNSPMVLYIVPGTPLFIENVPIGSYDVNELYEDENRMPVLTYSGMDEDLSSAVVHYTLDADSSTLQLTGLAVTKNNTRTGKVINRYSPKGKLILDKTVTIDGETYDSDKIAELKEGSPDDQALASQIEGITFTVTNFGTREVVAENVTFADILAAKAESGSYVIDQLPYGTYEVTESNTTIGTYLLTTTWIIDDQTKSSGQVTIGDENVDGAVVEITNEYEISTTDFTFYKIWHNLTGDVVDWDEDVESITVTISRTPSGLTDTFNYTYVVPITAFTAEGTEITANGADADAPKLKAKSGTGNEKYTFLMENIPKVNAARETYIYSVTETTVNGYRDPSYGHDQDGTVTINVDGTSAEDKQYIINTPLDAVSLPETGGTGTIPYTIAGGLLLAFTALAFIFRRRRFVLGPVDNNRPDEPWNRRR